MVTKAAAKKNAPKRSTKRAATKKWSAKVTKHSNALDLEKSVFKMKSAKKITESLRRSAEHSKRKKSGPFQSALSMLNFYITVPGKIYQLKKNNH